jgi:NADPH:quinone reductase-like Zn-dependent oxidoreductase
LTAKRRNRINAVETSSTCAATLALRQFYLATHIFDHPDQLPHRLRELSDGIRSGRIRIPITAFALEDMQHAHRAIERGDTTGKLVLHPW